MKTLENALMGLLAERDYVPLDAVELARCLKLPDDRKMELEEVLRKMEQEGRVAQIKGNRYVLPLQADLVPGRIRMTRQGRGFLQPDDPELKEIAVAESATGTAMHEDRVLVRRDLRPRSPHAKTPQPESGTVVRVLERRRTRIVGTLQKSRQFLFVIPDDPRIPHDIYVTPPRAEAGAAQVGDKVVVELKEWASRHTNPEGEIVEVLGRPDQAGVDMLSVLRQYDLPLRFSPAVLREAKRWGSEVRPEDLVGREDCRGRKVVTIDPDDAKDFDDAIGLEAAPGGHWRLWVHIADVSHYVRPGEAMDIEARKRGNSTYLVDRVIPMLPEGLSNELCSLKPNVDRLTKCVEFLLGADGAVVRMRFYPAVIRSCRRFTYQEAYAIIQRKPVGELEEMIHAAHQLAQKIRRARFHAGSLELDFPETKIRLDDQGRVLRIEKVENDASHQLIEEFMLMANEAVAARLMGLRRPAVYRVHEEPDDRRLQEYREEVLSHQVTCGNLRQRVEVQRLLHRLKALPIGAALRIGFLKSLPRARYATEPLGHYGLAKARYTHFTSPIRRYADLTVHRSLFEPGSETVADLTRTAEHLSITERNSADAERDSKDVKMYAFLMAQLQSGQPETYPALVTDVRNFGFFVEVQGLAMSGLVPVSTLEDDFYVFDSERAHLVGRRHRRVIRLGDTLQVEISKVDPFKKQVDFRLARNAELRPATEARSGKPAGGERGGRRTGAPRSGTTSPAPARGPIRRGSGRGGEPSGRSTGSGGPRREEGRGTPLPARASGWRERRGRSSAGSESGGSRSGTSSRPVEPRKGASGGPANPIARERTGSRVSSLPEPSTRALPDRRGGRGPREAGASGIQRGSEAVRRPGDGRKFRPQTSPKTSTPATGRRRFSREQTADKPASTPSHSSSGPSTQRSGTWGSRETSRDGGRRGGRGGRRRR